MMVEGLVDKMKGLGNLGSLDVSGIVIWCASAQVFEPGDWLVVVGVNK